MLPFTHNSVPLRLTRLLLGEHDVIALRFSRWRALVQEAVFPHLWVLVPLLLFGRQLIKLRLCTL